MANRKPASDDASDYQDYLDFQEYQKSQGEQSPAIDAITENPSQKRVSYARKALGAMFPPLAAMNAMEEAGGSVPAAARSAADTATLGNLRYNDRWKQKMEEDKRDYPGSQAIGKVAGYAGLALPALASGGGWLATLGLSGLQGALTNPETDAGIEDDLKTRAINAATSTALGGGAKILGAGAGKIGDWTMQKAVGAKEYLKGMGTRMADEGLWGTKGMMKAKIPGKLAAREAALNAELPRVTGQVSAVPSVDAISREGAMLVPKNPSLPISPGNTEAVQQVYDRSLHAASRGNLSPVDALDIARKIDRSAYDTSIPAGRFARKLDKLDSGAIRESLKKLADSQGLSGVRDNLGREQALIVAREALERPESLNEAMIRLATRASLAGAGGLGAGYASGNSVQGSLPYAAAAALASTPMGLSTAGQGATKFSQALPKLTPAMIDQLVRRSQSPEAEE